MLYRLFSISRLLVFGGAGMVYCNIVYFTPKTTISIYNFIEGKY